MWQQYEIQTNFAFQPKNTKEISLNLRIVQVRCKWNTTVSSGMAMAIVSMLYPRIY